LELFAFLEKNVVIDILMVSTEFMPMAFEEERSC